MPKLNNRVFRFILAVCIFYGTSEAFGSFVFNVQQVGGSIVVNGSGKLNTAALTFDFNQASSGAQIGPSSGFLSVGPTSFVEASVYSGIAGPNQFGPTSDDFLATFGSGDEVGVGFGTSLVVPLGYTSGTSLSDSATFSGDSFSTFSVIPGVYLYTWGSGPTADSLTINIGTVPEPASLAMLGVPAALALLRRRRVGFAGGRHV